MPGISVNDVLECITECIIENEDTELFVFFFVGQLTGANSCLGPLFKLSWC